ncbi:hypothetical protein MN205_18515 [Kineococcus sp. TRM81007]|uniref:hypothetical protein n=1 Tax=Kineococcus sp. TRM81007 TaxID=2925831 RepID=UPI001F5A2E05|nr:hypothetical protein [Kineococcus sp. TRM81007]MCI2240461.1 hypothetical protein [Kineococcus sp. TRM81007]
MSAAGADGTAGGTPGEGAPARGRSRKQVLLRLDPAVHEALARWAADDLRSVNAQAEFVLREALRRAGRMPADAGDLPRRGRPPAARGDGG